MPAAGDRPADGTAAPDPSRRPGTARRVTVARRSGHSSERRRRVGWEPDPRRAGNGAADRGGDPRVCLTAIAGRQGADRRWRTCLLRPPAPRRLSHPHLVRRPPAGRASGLAAGGAPFPASSHQWRISAGDVVVHAGCDLPGGTGWSLSGDHAVLDTPAEGARGAPAALPASSGSSTGTRSLRHGAHRLAAVIEDHCGRRVGVHSPLQPGPGRHQTARPRRDHPGRYELRGIRWQLRVQRGTAADLPLFVLKSGRYAWRLDQRDRWGRPVLPDAWRVAPEVAAGAGRVPDGWRGAGSGRT